MRNLDQIVIYDLEWTSWEGFRASGWSLPGKFREIIQIGAVALDCQQDFLETRYLNIVVRPTIHPQLSDYVQELTGIKQDLVDHCGVVFPEALEQFHAFCHRTDLTCYNGDDSIVIAENCDLHEIECPQLTPESINLRPLFSKLLKAAIGEVDSCELTNYLGLPSVGAFHDGLADARGIAAALRHLIDEPLAD